MNLKEFAASRNMPQSKAKKLAEKVLGEIPLDFSQDDIRKLDESLGNASANFLAESQAYLEGSEQLENGDSSSLSVNEDGSTEINKQVQEILGDDLLKQNILLYLSFLKQSLDSEKYRLDVAAFQLEQSYYQKLQHYQHSLYEDGKNRIRKVSNKALSLCTLGGVRQEIETNQDKELDSLLIDALTFLEAAE